MEEVKKLLRVVIESNKHIYSYSSGPGYRSMPSDTELLHRILGNQSALLQAVLVMLEELELQKEWRVRKSW